jgi:hypothetical protein
VIWQTWRGWVFNTLTTNGKNRAEDIKLRFQAIFNLFEFQDASFAIRSPCSVLSLPKEACRRVRIKERFEESRLEKVFNEPERPKRPFVLSLSK